MDNNNYGRKSNNGEKEYIKSDGSESSKKSSGASHNMNRLNSILSRILVIILAFVIGTIASNNLLWSKTVDNIIDDDTTTVVDPGGESLEEENGGEEETGGTSDELEEDYVYTDDAAYKPGGYDGYEDEFMIPGSDEHYIKKSEYRDLDLEQVQWAINEIYARHGRIFSGKPMGMYFNKCDWYDPTYSSNEFNEDWFNDYEEKNIKTLMKVRRKLTKK